MECRPSIQIDDVGQDVFQPFRLQTCLYIAATSGDNEDVLAIRRERRKRRRRDTRRNKDEEILIDSEPSRKEVPLNTQLSIVKDCDSSEVSFEVNKSEYKSSRKSETLAPV